MTPVPGFAKYLMDFDNPVPLYPISLQLKCCEDCTKPENFIGCQIPISASSKFETTYLNDNGKGERLRQDIPSSAYSPGAVLDILCPKKLI